MAKPLTIIVTYDDPECASTCDHLLDSLMREAQQQQIIITSRKGVPVPGIPAVVSGNGGASSSAPLVYPHREAVGRAMQEHFSTPADQLYVICLMHSGHSKEQYMSVKQMLSGNGDSAVEHQIVTHLSKFEEQGLVVKNLIRKIMAFGSGEVPQVVLL